MTRPAGLLIAAALLLASCGSAGGSSAERPSPSPSPAPHGSPAVGCTPSPLASPSASPTLAPSPPPSPSASPSPSPTGEPEAGPHVIHIVLSTQHLTAYAGSGVVLSTEVATGRPELPTPTGHFHIMEKHSPYLFISPWGPGSAYYYDPLQVKWAMLFAQGGYFIHDAWWQKNWGPGANVKSGSHGCVNVQPAVMGELYAWTKIGDDVVVTAA